MGMGAGEIDGDGTVECCTVWNVWASVFIHVLWARVEVLWIECEDEALATDKWLATVYVAC